MVFGDVSLFLLVFAFRMFMAGAVAFISIVLVSYRPGPLNSILDDLIMLIPSFVLLLYFIVR
jgi:hypothetical protein